MKPLLYSILIACCLAFTLSCSNPKSGSNSNDSLSELDKEARAEFKKLFENHFTQCGDSYYSELTETDQDQRRTSILRWEKVSFNANGGGIISENERRSGVEWKGWISFDFRANRHYIISDSKRNITGWEEWGADDSIATLGLKMPFIWGNAKPVQKKNSKWDLPETLNYEKKKYDYPKTDEISQSEVYKKIDCNSIPQ